MTQLKEQGRWESFGLSDLESVAQSLSQALPSSGVVAIHGSMGAGKTTLVRAVLQQWGAGEDASSPTFGLVQHHRVQRDEAKVEVRHFDLYRLEDEEEADRSGIAEMLADPVLNLVEWPERVPGLMPDDAWLFEVTINDDQTRTCILSQLEAR